MRSHWTFVLWGMCYSWGQMQEEVGDAVEAGEMGLKWGGCSCHTTQLPPSGLAAGFLWTSLCSLARFESPSGNHCLRLISQAPQDLVMQYWSPEEPRLEIPMSDVLVCQRKLCAVTPELPNGWFMLQTHYSSF